MISLQYNFAERFDSTFIRDTIAAHLSEYFDVIIIDIDPVAIRMHKVCEVIQANPELPADEILTSEKRLAARLGKGYLIRCIAKEGDAKIKICETCIQVLTNLKLESGSLCQLKSMISNLVCGEFEE